MAKGKGAALPRTKKAESDKPAPATEGLPPVNFGFRFMRLKDWCKYATSGYGKITNVKVEWQTPFDLESDQWRV